MTDLSKLDVSELLEAACDWDFDSERREACEAEITHRFAALTERISELEKALDEAYESCRLMEDRVNRLVDQSARVIELKKALSEEREKKLRLTQNTAKYVLKMGARVAVLEEALREHGRHHGGCHGAESCTCGLSAALGVRSEETT